MNAIWVIFLAPGFVLLVTGFFLCVKKEKKTNVQGAKSRIQWRSSIGMLLFLAGGLIIVATSIPLWIFSTGFENFLEEYNKH
jgi:Ni,Fe-hydrogenase I cytochrome b subunit